MGTIKYAKGEQPRDLDGAVGGLVLDRHQNWSKKNFEPDDYHPLGSGMNGPGNTQSYVKSGNKPDPEANRTGDKSLPVKKPRS
jgi:hypothetical protein